jgi:hypothetical protein
MAPRGGIRSRIGRWAAGAVAACAIAWLPWVAAADGGSASRVPKPVLAAPAGGPCVEDTATMRRSHMYLVRHQRDRTVRDGVRSTRHSLANCVACHAGKETGRVTGSSDAFCEGCHRYAAVRLDCFECHSDRAPAMAAAGRPAGTGSSR